MLRCKLAAGRRFDVLSVGAECCEPQARAGPACAEMILECFATDSAPDLTVGCSRREQDYVALKIVPLGLLRELDSGMFDQAESLQNGECRSKLNVPVSTLEA